MSLHYGRDYCYCQVFGSRIKNYLNCYESQLPINTCLVTIIV